MPDNEDPVNRFPSCSEKKETRRPSQIAIPKKPIYPNLNKKPQKENNLPNPPHTPPPNTQPKNSPKFEPRPSPKRDYPEGKTPD